MAMMTLVKNKKRFPGGRMLGYRSGEDEQGLKTLIPKPDEAKIVQLIFSEYLNGNGYRAIANKLNRVGYKTVKGNTFSTVAVRDILYNPTYAGKIRYNRYEDWEIKRRKGYNPNYIIVDGTHKPIIDKETFEKVQDRLKLESKQPQWNNKGENLLTGLLRCPECGSSMRASNTTNTLKDGTKKRIRYYSCSKFHQKGASVCHANSVRADKTESMILQRLKQMIMMPDALTRIVHELNKQIEVQREPWEKELIQIEKETADTQYRLNKWKDLIQTNPELAIDLEERISQLEVEFIEYKQRSQELTQILRTEGFKIKHSDATKVMALVNQLINDASSKSAIKAILRTFIDRITFDKDSKDNFKIYMHFSQAEIDKLNEYANKESTAKDNAVGSFNLPQLLKLII